MHPGADSHPVVARRAERPARDDAMVAFGSSSETGRLPARASRRSPGGASASSESSVKSVTSRPPRASPREGKENNRLASPRPSTRPPYNRPSREGEGTRKPRVDTSPPNAPRARASAPGPRAPAPRAVTPVAREENAATPPLRGVRNLLFEEGPKTYLVENPPFTPSPATPTADPPLHNPDPQTARSVTPLSSASASTSTAAPASASASASASAAALALSARTSDRTEALRAAHDAWTRVVHGIESDDDESRRDELAALVRALMENVAASFSLTGTRRRPDRGCDDDDARLPLLFGSSAADDVDIDVESGLGGLGDAGARPEREPRLRRRLRCGACPPLLRAAFALGAIAFVVPLMVVPAMDSGRTFWDGEYPEDHIPPPT